MHDKNRSVVVIPARGGSKRLTRKNLRELAGKPLIVHSIEAALACGCFGRIIVSTDDAEICTLAGHFPDVAIDARIPDLAKDTAKVAAVIEEICSRPEIQADFDVIGVMLPTAPFRRVADIRHGFERLAIDVDAVVSLAPYEFPPQMAVTLDAGGTMTPVFASSPLITGNTRSQDQQPAYRPNGSFYIAWISSFLRLRSFFTGRVKGVVMTRLGSSDIDEIADLELARLIVRGGLSESDFV